MTGGELARSLRELRPGLPIVIVSGYGEAINRARLASLGASSYLPKPFGGADLLRAVAEALRASPGRA
jgi:CheY-like chemotaxis protein